jgi:hypothetical protein
MRKSFNTRWNVRRATSRKGLEETLNGLTQLGWTIHEIIAHSAWSFTVVAFRQIRTWVE